MQNKINAYILTIVLVITTLVTSTSLFMNHNKAKASQLVIEDFTNYLIDLNGDGRFVPPAIPGVGQSLPAGSDGIDSVGPFKINGQMVWCIEPSIYTANGINYTNSGVDIVRDPLGIEIRRNNGTWSQSNQSGNLPANGLMPFVYMEMPLEYLDAIATNSPDTRYWTYDSYLEDVTGGPFYGWDYNRNTWTGPHRIGNGTQTGGSGANGGYMWADVTPEKIRAFKQVLRDFRQQPEYIQFMTIQFFMWRNAAFVFLGETSRNGNKDFYMDKLKDITGSHASNTTAFLNRTVHDGTANRTYGALLQTLSQVIGANIHVPGSQYNQREDTAAFEYVGGANAWNGAGGAQRMVMRGGRFIVADAYLQMNKEILGLNGTNEFQNKPNFDLSGLRFNVYSDSQGTQLVGTMTTDGSGRSNILKVRPNKDYYIYELDANGNKITGDNEKVKSNYHMYNSGYDKNSGTVKAHVRPTSANTKANPLVTTFVNKPELVNFTMKKKSDLPFMVGFDKQFDLSGAEYGLFYDAQGNNPVRRADGTEIKVVTDERGSAEFTNLYRGVYYVKELKAPPHLINGATRYIYKLDRTIHRVDLTSGGDNKHTERDAADKALVEYSYTDKVNSTENYPNDRREKLSFQKRDAQTDQAQGQGEATLAGAEFKVEWYQIARENKPAFTVKKHEAVYRTDNNGAIDITNRAQLVSTTNQTKMNDMFNMYAQKGTFGVYDYKITELKAPNGYLLGGSSANTVVEKRITHNDISNNPNYNWSWDPVNWKEDNVELILFKRQKMENEWQRENNVWIPGSTFELKRTGGRTQTATIDNTGKLSFKGLVNGHYEVRETSAPKYITNKQVISFDVQDKVLPDGKVTHEIVNFSTSRPTDDNGNYEISYELNRAASNGVKGSMDITVDNIPHRTSAKVVKANEKGAKLKGATFTLTHIKDDGSEEKSDLRTNDKGELVFPELIIGDWYKIEETAAPIGYKLPQIRKTIEFRAEAIPVRDSYAVSYKVHSLDKWYETNTRVETTALKKLTAENTMQDGMKFTVDHKTGVMSIEFNMVNHTWQKLPNTGDNMMLILLGLAGLLIVGGIASTVVIRRRQQ